MAEALGGKVKTTQALHVAFEGIDGSGKSSALSLVSQMLQTQGFHTIVVDKSRNRPIRTLYRELTSGDSCFPSANTSLLLSMADYIHARDQIVSSSPTIVLWDRYVYSAFSDALSLGIAIENVANLRPFFVHADIAVVFEIDPILAAQRKTSISVAEAGGPEFLRAFSDRTSSYICFQEGVRRAYCDLNAVGLLPDNVTFLDSTTRLPQDLSTECCQVIQDAHSSKIVGTKC